MTTITIPKEYGYTVAAVSSTFFLTFYQMINVGRARKAAKIAYPQMYAEKAEAAASKEAQRFNCCQRAHQNTLEWLPQIVASTLVVGLKYPTYAAAMCGLWTVARLMYTVGYSTGTPSKRFNPFSMAANFGVLLSLVLGGTAFTAYKFITE